MKTFNKYESNVRSYCRSFPVVFKKAKNSCIYSVNNKKYIDFFAGAGSLNYGHNNPKIKKVVIEYLQKDQIVQGLDMATTAKKDFILNFNNIILKPRKFNYKMQFPGPTGTNCVESALKLARKYTGRKDIIHFSKSFHGMTIGALSVTSDQYFRRSAGIPLSYAKKFEFNQINQLSKYLRQSKKDKLPAGILLETIQGEGGINVADFNWLKEINKLAKKYGIVLIIDDIQAGCGRTGIFFSFEKSGIKPDIICMSKSISAYGLPMSVSLIKPYLDIWKPAEHNGTFRGNNLAFIAASKALEIYWENSNFTKVILAKEKIILKYLNKIVKDCKKFNFKIKGRGMFYGLEGDPKIISDICCQAFKSGLIIETAGHNGEVLKIMPPLTIEERVLQKGLNLLENSIKKVASQ